MNFSLYSVIYVLYLQFVSYSYGQRRFTSFNPRLRNPLNLAQRQFLKEKERTRLEIPSFLNNHDIPWAYANNDVLANSGVQPSVRNPVQVSRPSIRNPVRMSKSATKHTNHANEPSVSDYVPTVRNPIPPSKPSIIDPIPTNKPSIIDHIPTNDPSIIDPILSINPSRSKGTSRKHKQYNQKGKVFGYCDIANDEDLDGLFPGLFQSEPEILNEADKVIKHERWHANTIRTYGSSKQKAPHIAEPTTAQRMAVSNNLTEVTVTRPPIIGAPVCKCCETISQHDVYRNITIDNRSYDVIQLPGKFQAIPVGRCPETNLCLHGDCVQHYSVHHVLIWNNSVPYWPPFDFALIEYPTFCTWENIGT